MDPNQSITIDELIDILLFVTPKSWQKEMSCQGFDPMIHDLNSIVSFMEHIEETEEFEPCHDSSSKKVPARGRGKRKKMDNIV